MEQNKSIKEAAEHLDCPYNFTSRCTMGRCDCSLSKIQGKPMSVFVKLDKAIRFAEFTSLMNFNYDVDAEAWVRWDAKNSCEEWASTSELWEIAEKAGIFNKKKHMNWTEPTPPTVDVSRYHHIISKSPIGEFKIEWKGWKESPSYEVSLNDEYLETRYDLNEAKKAAWDYILSLQSKLSEFISSHNSAV